jgi:hypothetical protein
MVMGAGASPASDTGRASRRIAAAGSLFVVAGTIVLMGIISAEALHGTLLDRRQRISASAAPARQGSSSSRRRSQPLWSWPVRSSWRGGALHLESGGGWRRSVRLLGAVLFVGVGPDGGRPRTLA